MFFKCRNSMYFLLLIYCFLCNIWFINIIIAHKLKDLIYMPLNSFESSALVKFLSENEDPHAQETLVIYYLLRCNYFEAHKVNEKLSMTTLVIIYFFINAWWYVQIFSALQVIMLYRAKEKFLYLERSKNLTFLIISFYLFINEPLIEAYCEDSKSFFAVYLLITDAKSIR